MVFPVVNDMGQQGCFGNCILYFSHKIYLNLPKHKQLLLQNRNENSLLVSYQNNASEPNFLSSNDRQYDFIAISAIRFYFSSYWKKKSHVKMSFMTRTIMIYLHQMKGNSACTILYSQINCWHCTLLLKIYFQLGQCWNLDDFGV